MEAVRPETPTRTISLLPETPSHKLALPDTKVRLSQGGSETLQVTLISEVFGMRPGRYSTFTNAQRAEPWRRFKAREAVSGITSAQIKRPSRFVIPIKVPEKLTDVSIDALIKAVCRLPTALRNSLNWD